MFTGIVHSALIKSINPSETGWTVVINAPIISSKVSLGDSVAIDGACLSFIKIDQENLHFFVSLESIDKTIIQFYKIGQIVNIELPLQVNGYMGGHYVLGHVDTTASIINIKTTDQAWTITIEFPTPFSKYVVYKGSVTINGVSLTINNTIKNTIELCIIPVTLEKTNLKTLKVGDKVNIEFDILAKYTEKLLTKEIN